MLLQKRSKFRKWVVDMWMDNKEERDKFGLPRLTLIQYIRNYRWWLKSKYRKNYD